MINETIKTELTEVFRKQIEMSVRHNFATLVNAFGPGMKGIYNSNKAKVWCETVRHCCNQTSNIPAQNEYILDDQLIASFAGKLANEMTKDVIAKVNEKIGELKDANVVRVNGANFCIVGRRDVHKVCIEQNQILNVSSKGKLFNQFPSRIYVDGKFTSAAKFATIGN
jgi:hypothetical protein